MEAPNPEKVANEQRDDEEISPEGRSRRIGRLLSIGPSTYHIHAAKRRDPSLVFNRAKRDEAMKIEVQRAQVAENRMFLVSLRGRSTTRVLQACAASSAMRLVMVSSL